jgi:multidrug efflux pump subunit AcrA (membrane-fusion protein)
VVTPAASDWLREQGIVLVRGEATSGAKTAAANSAAANNNAKRRLSLAVWESRFDPQPLVGALVREGVACEARFYGFPDQLFPGTVGRLSPSLSTERRTLRVPFELTDPQERLKPGMFAEIGLGTEQRRAILVPAEAALHVGLADFVFLAEDEPGTYRVAEVTVGEPHGGKLEILAGVSEGIRLIGANAILLKPMVVQLLEQR